MQEHPEQVPAWAPKLEPWQMVALGRYIIWGWPEGEAGGDLLRAGMQPDPIAYHGSNEMALAPSRTAHARAHRGDRSPSHLVRRIPLLRNAHLRRRPGVFGRGDSRPAFPLLGHSRYLSIAMTTGGPDTSDIYEEEVRDGKYKFQR